MSLPRAGVVSTPPVSRTFGEEPASSSDTPEGIQPKSGRISFSEGVRRPSFINRLRGVPDEENAIPETTERAPIPSALQPGEGYTTPLPALPMIVLSICMLGEFLSANVCTPFLLFMVGEFDGMDNEATIAFWTGILVSVFFLTQFLTSLLWATIADKHGQRAVLFVSLLGSAITCSLFGTTTTLNEAIAVRLLQGIFGGAVGVARGSVTNVGTDASNESQAYAILGFAWGLGGVAGAVIGGTFESPTKKWPGIFKNTPILERYPYLLPCVLASSILFIGAVLSLFLARDAGPRSGGIRLPEKADVQEEESPVIDEEPELRTLLKKASKRFSGYFGNRTQEPTVNESSVLLSQTTPKGRTSRAASGSAYGYMGSYRNRLASTATIGARRESIASSVRRRRPSNLVGPETSDGTEDFNFAQRLLMSNADHVTNIADLWVASALNVDNEDPFESDTEDGDSLTSTEDDDERSQFQPGSSPGRQQRALSNSANRLSRSVFPSRRPSSTVGRLGIAIPPARRSSNAFGTPVEGTPPAQRRPSIFQHPGVRTPPAVVEAQQLLVRTEEGLTPMANDLAPIAESRRQSRLDVLDVPEVSEKAVSLNSQLPILVIIQYGALALHNTTHDQVFMSYLVTDFDSGGLNLNAGHFAQLIALMCACQIFYQFYLYPNLGPPRGRFSHLAMFRIGGLLYIPSYLAMIFLRQFASETSDGNAVLMTLLSIATAVRYCAGTFSYTAASILLNYMTPPSAIGYANGIAQSVISLARFFGPIIGGWIWSVSIQDNPAGYPIPFIVCAVGCALAITHSLTIR